MKTCIGRERRKRNKKGVAPVSWTYYISRDNEEHGGRSSSSDWLR